MDGSRTIHGVERTHPGQVVGQYTKGNFNRIEYQGNDTWYGLRLVLNLPFLCEQNAMNWHNTFSDDAIIDVYKSSDFRQSFVWRGLCFKTEEDLQNFHTVLREKRYQPVEEILSILEADMKKNGKMSKSESIHSMGHADFGRKLQVICPKNSSI